MNTRCPHLLAAGVLAAVALTGCIQSPPNSDRSSASTTRSYESDQAPALLVSGTVAMSDSPEWLMHPVTSRLRLVNGLGPARIGGISYNAYATAEEGDSRYAVVVGPTGNPSSPSSWHTVELVPKKSSPAGPGLPPTICAEYATLADLDGNGRPDVIGAQGAEVGEGNEPGIRIYWGPAAKNATDPNAWQDAGRIPSTIGVGHFERAQAVDLNDDGAPDLVVGGRALYTTGRNAGIGWVSAPRERSQRRDLSLWQYHSIDPRQTGGYGFAVGDINADGRPDIVLENGDKDTPASERQIVWYENPGPARIDQPWPKHLVASTPTIGDKAQVAIGDLGDGRMSIVTAVPGKVLIFQPTRAAGHTRFRSVVLNEPPALSGLGARMVSLIDIDGRGRNDIVLGFGHDGNAAINVNHAAVAWLGRDGPNGSWVAHVIRWGAGRTMALTSFGEKWQIGIGTDLNGDGRMDLLADKQEWWVDPTGEFGDWTTPNLKMEGVGVVWFERPAGAAATACFQRVQRCRIAAARPSSQGDGTWVERDLYSGALNSSYVQDFNALPTSTRCSGVPKPCGDPSGGLTPAATRGDTYVLRLTGGSYAVWVHTLHPSWMPAGTVSSAWLSVGGQDLVAVAAGALGTWTWSRLSPIVSLPAGKAQLVLRVRTGGIAIDRIVLTKNLGASPPTAP